MNVLAAFFGSTIAGEKSFRLFLKIAKIASRTAKFLMDDQIFASPLSFFLCRKPWDSRSGSFRARLVAGRCDVPLFEERVP